MWVRASVVVAALAIALASLATVWIAFPTDTDLELATPLRAWTADDPPLVAGKYATDFAPLAGGFQSQIHRSFCGPASIATVLRAYGVKQSDQAAVFPSVGSNLDVFFSGMSLAELAALAQHVGLRSEIAYADTLSLHTFRERLKSNVSREGDFVLINYDRRVLKQTGAGHISPIGAYDDARDAFLVLDQAAYKYPFTWVPTSLLYDAARTRDSDRYRGVLFIHAYDSPD